MVTSLADTGKALSIFMKAACVRCICHRNPDGDAIGSLLGIGLLIERAFPDKEVTFHCVDPVPESFLFLPAAFRVQRAPILKPDDVIVFVDCAVPKMTEMHETHPQLFDGSHQTVWIDHHPGPANFATANLVRSTAASTCEIITDLTKEWNWSLTPDIATCLLTGIFTDTGGLLHSNTSSHVYRTVARLMREGGRRQEVVDTIYRKQQLSTLRLWGRVLEKISLTEEGGAVSAVTEGDFRSTGADYAELTGAIDYVNAVPGMRFSMVLSERDGKVKGSIRTLRDDVDVAEMAGKFHGGGHKRAAGFAIPGKLKPEFRWKVVEETPPEETGK